MAECAEDRGCVWAGEAALRERRPRYRTVFLLDVEAVHLLGKGIVRQVC